MGTPMKMTATVVDPRVKQGTLLQRIHRFDKEGLARPHKQIPSKILLQGFLQGGEPVNYSLEFLIHLLELIFLSSVLLDQAIFDFDKFQPLLFQRFAFLPLMLDPQWHELLLRKPCLVGKQRQIFIE
jgi:hypothetical protein